MTTRAVLQLTIGGLAEAAGMTVRNVRNHHSRGLLPPPHMKARTAYYDERHLERLRLIRSLQDAGLNLAAVQRLLACDGAADAVLAAFAEADARRVTERAARRG
jgi:DNA-binding transcriptional MerR regulator